MNHYERNKYLDYIEEILHDYPPILAACDLAQLAGWTPQRVYVLAVRVNKGELGLLPTPLKTPNSNLLRFTKSAVKDWFIQAYINTKKVERKSRGRPRGSTTRKGIGRAELEGMV